ASLTRSLMAPDSARWETGVKRRGILPSLIGPWGGRLESISKPLRSPSKPPFGFLAILIRKERLDAPLGRVLAGVLDRPPDGLDQPLHVEHLAVRADKAFDDAAGDLRRTLARFGVVAHQALDLSDVRLFVGHGSPLFPASLRLCDRRAEVTPLLALERRDLCPPIA